MIRIFNFMPERDLEWIRTLDNINYVSDMQGLTVIDTEAGRYAGAFLLYDFKKNSCYCHVIVGNKMMFRRDKLEAAFHYAFNVCGIKILLGHNTSDNYRHLRFLERLGFSEHSRVLGGASDGVDDIVMILRKENCRYLKGK